MWFRQNIYPGTRGLWEPIILKEPFELTYEDNSRDFTLWDHRFIIIYFIFFFSKSYMCHQFIACHFAILNWFQVFDCTTNEHFHNTCITIPLQDINTYSSIHFIKHTTFNFTFASITLFNKSHVQNSFTWYVYMYIVHQIIKWHTTLPFYISSIPLLNNEHVHNICNQIKRCLLNDNESQTEHTTIRCLFFRIKASQFQTGRFYGGEMCVF